MNQNTQPPAEFAKRYSELLCENRRLKKQAGSLVSANLAKALRDLLIDVEAGICDGDSSRDARALLDGMDVTHPAEPVVGMTVSAGLSAADVAKVAEHGAEVAIIQKNATIKAQQDVLAERDAEIAKLRAAAPVGDTLVANKDVEWLIQCADAARAQSEVATRIREACKAAAPAVPDNEEGGPTDQLVSMLHSQRSRLLDENAKLRAALSDVPAVGGALVANAEQDQAHVMPPTRGTDSQQDPSERAFDALYGAVMNIPCKPDAGWGLIAVNHYKFGHRDARHAAADLIAEAASGFREGRNAQPESVGSPGSAAAPAEPNLEQLLIEHRIGMTPEYEGGWNAYVYLDSEAFESAGFGATPSEAVKVALLATHQPIPTGEKA